MKKNLETPSAEMKPYVKTELQKELDKVIDYLEWGHIDSSTIKWGSIDNSTKDAK